MKKMSAFKKTSEHGFSLPTLGLGTWQMGGRHERDPANNDDKDVAAIRLALENGIMHIDTAEAYAAGHTEELVGEAIRDHDRTKIILASKVSPEHLRYDDVLRSHEASLKRLGTDYLDLYLIHHPNPDVPLQETMRALVRLADEETIGAIGVSNFTTWRLQEAQHHSDYPIATVQAHYNLGVREVEHEGLLRYCQEEGIILTAWRPIEKGAILATNSALTTELMAKYNATASQLAIAWLCEQERVVTLVKTSNPNHLEENIAALNINISSEDVEQLRAEYKPQVNASPTFPLG